MQRLETIPKNIIFDFGGVIVDIDVEYAVRKFTKMGVGQIDLKDIHPYNKGIFLDFEKGLVSPADFLANLRERMSGGKDYTDSQIAEVWNGIILPYDYDRFEVLVKLRNLGHKLFLLSNTNVIHHEYFEGLFDRENPFGKKFRDYFDHVYYSDEMKMRKPDIEIYQRVLDEQQLVPGDTIFIDDNQINLEAPKKLGMQVCHFKPDDTLAGLFGF